MHSVSDIVVDGGSFLNGRVANNNFNTTKRPNQNDQMPVVRGSYSHGQKTSTV